jgi:2-methylisocitrate lyase-like PEP mutase family enzyme
MCGKIRAACDARTDDDFLVIARTDALLVEGFEQALDRGRAYEAAGADMIFVESPLTMAHLEGIPKAFKVPTLFNMASSGKTPFLHRDELSRLGFKFGIYPNFAILSAIPAVRHFLRELQEKGTVAHLVKDMATFTEWFDIVGMNQVKADEEKYGLPEEKTRAVLNLNGGLAFITRQDPRGRAHDHGLRHPAGLSWTGSVK